MEFSRETISMFCHVQRGVKEGVGEEVETEISYAFKTQNHHLKPLPLFAISQSPLKRNATLTFFNLAGAIFGFEIHSFWVIRVTNYKGH